jgi:hypothetical protein
MCDFTSAMCQSAWARCSSSWVRLIGCATEAGLSRSSESDAIPGLWIVFRTLVVICSFPFVGRLLGLNSACQYRGRKTTAAWSEKGTWITAGGRSEPRCTPMRTCAPAPPLVPIAPKHIAAKQCYSTHQQLAGFRIFENLVHERRCARGHGSALLACPLCAISGRTHCRRHRYSITSSASARSERKHSAKVLPPASVTRVPIYFFTSAHSLWSSGRHASSAGMVASCL